MRIIRLLSIVFWAGALSLGTALVAPPGAAPGSAPHALADSSRPRWLWPLDPRPRLVTPFEPPAQRWMAGHRGVDLESSPGAEVRSPADGVVSFSGTVVDRGVITITTADGRKSSFEPVAERLPRGTRVAKGQRIAIRDPETSHEGCSGCLHWGVREGEDYVNPLLFVEDLEPSVLWPIPEDLK